MRKIIVNLLEGFEFFLESHPTYWLLLGLLLVGASDVFIVGCGSTDFYIKENPVANPVIVRGESSSLNTYHVSLLGDMKQKWKAIEYNFGITSVTFTLDCRGNQLWQSPLDKVSLRINGSSNFMCSTQLTDFKEEEFTYGINLYSPITFGPQGANLSMTANINSDVDSVRVKSAEITGRKAGSKEKRSYILDTPGQWFTVVKK